MWKQGTASRWFPAQRLPERGGIDRDQQQVVLAGEMLFQRQCHLIGRRQMDEAVAHIVAGAKIAPAGTGLLPRAAIADLVHQTEHLVFRTSDPMPCYAHVHMRSVDVTRSRVYPFYGGRASPCARRLSRWVFHSFMSSGFTAKPLALGQLLSDPYRFRIPSFQRPYSWTTKEAGQLLDDLTLALEEQTQENASSREYFLGAILLNSAALTAADSSASAAHDVVDGQQRLVTLTILLAVLRDLLARTDRELPRGLREHIECTKTAGPHRAYRIELRERERDFFRLHVQEPLSTAKLPETDGLTEVEGRILEVREHLVAELRERSPQELAHIASFIAQQCQVALISAEGIDRAYRIFMVLNDRGRPLQRNDILKAQILAQIEERARAKADSAWDRTDALLGSDFEALFSHIRAAELSPKAQIIAGVREVIANAGGGRAFVEEMLEPYGRAFHSLLHAHHAGSPRSPEIRRFLTYLGWLGSADWVPPAMLWWRLNSADPEKLHAFLQALDRLSYALRLLGIGADKRASRFRAVVQAIRQGTVMDDPRSPLELGRDELRNILYNLRSLHLRSPLVCKLVLLRLNDELAGGLQSLPAADFTVEHVLPQKPGRHSAWRDWFPVAEERERCTNSIGNLVLVRRRQNENARNRELPDKLEIYFGAPNPDVPAITAELNGISELRPEHIMAREERLLTIIKTIWRLDNQKANPAPANVPPPTKRQAAAKALKFLAGS